MVDVANLPELNPEQLRELAHQLIAQIASKVIPASTLGQWVGETGVALQPVVDALKDAV